MKIDTFLSIDKIVACKNNTSGHRLNLIYLTSIHDFACFFFGEDNRGQE